MARNRSLSPDLFTDDKILALPYMAVATYIGLLSQADDEGRIEWRPTQLAARIAGFRSDVNMQDFVTHLNAIAEVGLMVVYSIGGREYAYHPAWFKHQYVNRRTDSKLPLPTGDEHERYLVSRNAVINRAKENESSVKPKGHSRKGHGELTEDSVQTHGVISESHVPLESESESEETTDVVPDGSHTHTGTHEDAPEGGSNLGLPLGVSLDPSEPLAPTPEPPKPPAPAGKNSKKTRPQPSGRDLAAYAITEAMVKLVAPHLGKAMTQAEWRKRNNDAARRLVDAGSTPEDVCAAFEAQAERGFAYANLSLSKLQDTMIRDSAKATAPKLTLVPELERGFCYNQPATRRKGQFVEGWDPWGPDGVPREKVLAWLDDGVDLGNWPIHPMVKSGLVAA